VIANQTKGKGFGGVLTYLLSKEKSQIIGGNMIGENIKELSTEFKKSRELRPNLKNCVWHTSLSLPHNETLSDEKWDKLGNEYATKMGFKGSQFVIVRHHDTEHEHIHIVASRISLDGNVVSDSQDYKRSEKVVRGLEKSYSLTPTLSSHEIGRSAPTKGELFKAVREQKPSTKRLLQTVIDDVTADRPSASDFVERLQSHGIEVIPNMAKTGHISGISFVHEGEQMKGSDLGRGYTWSKLCKGKINYDKYDINFRDFIKTQQRTHLRDNHWGSSQTDREVQNGFHKRDSQSVSTDNFKNGGNKIRNHGTSNFGQSHSKRCKSRHEGDLKRIGGDKDFLETTKSSSSILSDLSSSDRNGEDSRVSDLEDILVKHRKKQLLKKKAKQMKKGFSLDIDF